MALSWNEIKTRATAFSKEWEDEVSEDAEAKSFWDDFFNVFGIGRRRVATFEQQVKKLDQKTGFIDLLWKGVILIEHKSRGKDLDKAYQQAKDYFPGLKEKELPRYILVSDFERFRLYDLEEALYHEFKLNDFVNHVHLFGFITNRQKRVYKEQDPVNIDAAEMMGKLHDKLKEIGYTGHHLELYLVRLVFCLFADDTNIFEKDIFYEYLELKTNEDGSDLAAHLGQLFQILNTPNENRYKNLDESLNAFRYINGKLFEEILPMAHFDSEMRKILIDACLLDWGAISPAVFGSLFQSVMDKSARRNLGAHYTSEKNILKLIRPLFLDELWAEFEKIKNDRRKLNSFHDRLSKLRFFDPACGCGNFLIISYRELRLLEIAVIKVLLKNNLRTKQKITDIHIYVLIDVDTFYGIEYEEFPALIAQVAMWLIDHQMNELVSETFGDYYARLPLDRSATIKHGNALKIDWLMPLQPDLIDLWKKDDVDNLHYNYILGNPPFVGKHLQNIEQKTDMENVFMGVSGAGVMDYVAAWYVKAAQYMQKINAIEKNNLTKTKTAFVSTNSISQGEQVGVLWNELFNKYHCKINFAHRTFKWGNEAKGNAAVHVVIIGFSDFDVTEKFIYEYDDIKGDAHEIKVKNINPYLVEGNDSYLPSRKKPICNIPEMIWGSKPVDNGNFLFTEEEMVSFLKAEPNAKKYFKELISAQEYLNNEKRYCLWLKDIDPSELRKLPMVLARVENVKLFREVSKKEPTRKAALFPTLFAEIRQPNNDFIFFPLTTSENRTYIPISFFQKDKIVNNSSSVIPNANKYHFGILISLMHMSWVRFVCGRLESRYRYSNTIVYNNFPWPKNITDTKKKLIEKSAQSVLDARASFPNSSLADLYNPNTMPPILVKAHQALDKAVDLCYRSQPFINETKRIEFLFELYDKYTAGLFVKKKKTKNPKV